MPPDATPVYWLTEESPVASNGGGALRQAGLIEQLARHADVHLVVAGGHAPPDIEAVVAGTDHVGGRPAAVSRLARAQWAALGLGGISTPELASAAPARRALAERIDTLDAGTIVVLNHPGLVPLVRRRADVRWILELQYAPTAQLTQEAAHATGARAWRLRRYAASMARAERRWYPSAQRVVVPSDDDAASIRATVSGASIAVVPNAIDADRYCATPLGDAPVAVMPASLSFAPNVDGATWLVHDVWPAVRARVPDATLALVGRDPTDAVRALGRHPGVEVHANVPDMQPWFQRARAIVVPLRFGTGTRLKALEAMAMARPVVGTTMGLAGLRLRHGEHALIADEAASLAAHIALALTGDTRALTDAATELLRAEFTWDVVGARFAREVLGA